MKKVYLFLSGTHTFFSRMISFFTRSKYAHTSLCLTGKFENMYSFARINMKPFPAGFTIESIHERIYKKMSDSNCMVLSLEVTDEQFCSIKEVIDGFIVRKDELKYAYVGAFLCWLRIGGKFKNKYFCTQFVTQTLEQCTDIKLHFKPEKMRPKDYLNSPYFKKEYEGSIANLVKLLGDKTIEEVNAERV